MSVWLGLRQESLDRDLRQLLQPRVRRRLLRHHHLFSRRCRKRPRHTPTLHPLRQVGAGRGWEEREVRGHLSHRWENALIKGDRYSVLETDQREIEERWGNIISCNNDNIKDGNGDKRHAIDANKGGLGST